MKKRETILIVDRNPNVREYLKRELGCEGYYIRLAENCGELFQIINDKHKLDLIIIDPDLPDAEKKSILHELQKMQPRTPVVIHTLITDYLNPSNTLFEAVLVEKDGNSIERLKDVIERQLDLKRYYPEPLLETARELAGK